MNVLRRFLLCLWSLILMAVAAVLGLCAFRPATVQYSLDKLYRVLCGSQNFWWLLLASVILLFLGALSLFISLARKSVPTQVVVGNSEGGQVNISLDAVDNVVRQAALSVGGVKDVTTKLKAASNGVGINLQISMPYDTNVPETATAVQTVVKEQVQAITGLTVAEVAVLISTVEGKPAKIVENTSLGG